MKNIIKNKNFWISKKLYEIRKQNPNKIVHHKKIYKLYIFIYLSKTFLLKKEISIFPLKYMRYGKTVK